MVSPLRRFHRWLITPSGFEREVARTSPWRHWSGRRRGVTAACLVGYLVAIAAGLGWLLGTRSDAPLSFAPVVVATAPIIATVIAIAARPARAAETLRTLRTVIVAVVALACLGLVAVAMWSVVVGRVG